MSIGCRGESLKNEQLLTDSKIHTEYYKDNIILTQINRQQQPPSRKHQDEPSKSKTINDHENSQNSRSENSAVRKDNPIEKRQPKFFSDPKQWTEIISRTATNNKNKYISINFPYATTDNFVKTKLYSCARCFLRPDVASAVKKAHSQLQQQEYGLRLFDCYRPHKVQYKMWEIKPDERYVGNPKKGSDHNRGIAVDLTIIDRNGNPLDMGTPFDDFSSKAHHTYRKLSPTIIKNRLLLKNTMASVGFHHVNTEWWHYAWNGKKPDIAEAEWNCPTLKSDLSNIEVAPEK